jgi:hypothetical protein
MTVQYLLTRKGALSLNGIFLMSVQHRLILSRPLKLYHT